MNFFILKPLCIFFFIRKKRDSCVVVIIPHPTIQLGKPMGTTSSNWSSETPNPHTPQALLVFGTSRNNPYAYLLFILIILERT